MKLRSQIITSILVVISAIIVSLLPRAARILKENVMPIGEYSYFYLTNAAKNQFSDPLSFIIGQFNLTPFGSWIAVVILNALLILLFYIILRYHISDNLFIVIILFVIMLSPASLYLSSNLSPYIFALILLILSLIIVNTRIPYFSVFPLVFLVWFDWLTIISCIVILLGYLWYKRSHGFMYLIPAVPTFLFAAIQFLRPRPYLLEIFPHRAWITEILADFGGMHGFGIFTLLLFTLGLILSWKHKKQLFPAYFGVLMFALIFTFISQHAVLFFYPFIAVFAASALMYLWKREWSLPTIRYFTLAVVLYGIIFSGLAYIERGAVEQPDLAAIESLQWLNNKEHGIVLSHPQKSYWISYIAQMDPITHYRDPDFNKKSETINSIFKSRDLKNTTDLLAMNDVEYIWIDGQMKAGQVWREDDEGLQFLFRNERFKRIYSKNDIEIWRFT
jgi:hypothetical protein